jgi:hypothetical protein
VVEVQERNTLLPAIDARMYGEVFVNLHGQRLAHESAITLESPCLRDTCDVPGARRGALALKANPVSCPFGTRPKRELDQGFGLLADATDSWYGIAHPQLLWPHDKPLARRLAVQMSERCSESVAICTPNFTLCDFVLNRGPAPASGKHAGNVALFVREVIELEDDDVVLTAINARMGPKVIDHPPAVFRSSLAFCASRFFR